MIIGIVVSFSASSQFSKNNGRPAYFADKPALHKLVLGLLLTDHPNQSSKYPS